MKTVKILPEIHEQLKALAVGQEKSLSRMTNEVLRRVLNPDMPLLEDDEIWGKPEQEEK